MTQQRTVSVIMPIRNEAGFIARSLGAVLEQDYPASLLEVVVADGMSTDGTRDVIRALAIEHPGVRVKIVDNPGRIVPTGFNRALTETTGDVIVRVDGHTIIEPDYVRQCVAALVRTGADNVGGRMDAVGKGAFGRAVALATSSRFGVGGARFHYSTEEEWVDTVYMGAWPRAVFQRIGLFDEEQVRNQDDEFNYRLRERGGRILLDPRIRSRYYNRTSLRSLWKQYFQYGFWKIRVMQKHPGQMSLRHFVPAAFVASLAIGAVLALVSGAGLLLLGAAALSYAAANIVASVLVGIGRKPSEAVLLPGAFATIHVGYGAGFLVGLARFATRWRDRAGQQRPQVKLA